MGVKSVFMIMTVQHPFICPSPSSLPIALIFADLSHSFNTRTLFNAFDKQHRVIRIAYALHAGLYGSIISRRNVRYMRTSIGWLVVLGFNATLTARVI